MSPAGRSTNAAGDSSSPSDSNFPPPPPPKPRRAAAEAAGRRSFAALLPVLLPAPKRDGDGLDALLIGDPRSPPLGDDSTPREKENEPDGGGWSVELIDEANDIKDTGDGGDEEGKNEPASAALGVGEGCGPRANFNSVDMPAA